MTQKVEYLSYVLLGKWVLVLFNIGLSTYLVLTIFKGEKDEKRKGMAKKEFREVNSALSEREKAFLTKKIRSKAEILMQKS